MTLAMDCGNEQCRFFEVTRLVPQVEVSEGVYLRQDYICECGHFMRATGRRRITKV